MKHWIRWNKFEISREDIEEATRGAVPERIFIHWVFVRDQAWPVKQIISLVTGLNRNEFHTHDALRVLRDLGYAPHWRGEPGLGYEPSS